jgi:hypothetical protein
LIVRFRVQLPESTFEWESNVAPFRVGRGDSCALRFEGEAAKYASWEHAEFSMNDGVAYITDLGSSNGTFVEGVRITEAKPLWTGAVVQIGGKGPRLEVLDVAAASRPLPIPIVGVPPAQPIPIVALAPSRRQPGRRRPKLATHHVALMAVAVLAILAGVFLASRASSDRGRPVADASVAQIERRRPDKPSPTPKRQPPAEPVEPPPPRPVLPPPSPPDSVVPPPITVDETPITAGLAAYRLIVVEDPQARASWSLAGSIVVGDRALLTTATIAVELTKYLDRGFIASAMKPPQGARSIIVDRRIHAAFQKAEPAEQLFFDVALLYTDEPLENAVTLPSADELDELEIGQPVTCLAIEHGFETLHRFQRLAPRAYSGAIYAITGLPPSPGPRLLHLDGKFSDKFSGSPIMNEQGQLIALYCEPAASGGPAGVELHYAKVIDPPLIERGLNKPDDTIWVPLTAPSSPQESAK